MIDRLKKFDANRMDIDELVEMFTVANAMKSTYEAENLELPEWLGDATRELKNEIKTRQRDSMERRLRELKSRREAVATPEEKRNKLDQQIAALEESLK